MYPIKLLFYFHDSGGGEFINIVAYGMYFEIKISPGKSFKQYIIIKYINYLKKLIFRALNMVCHMEIIILPVMDYIM